MITSGLTRPILIRVWRWPRLVDQAAQPQVFARPSFLIERARGHLAQAGRRRPLDDSVEPMDLAGDMAIRLKDLQEGLSFTKDLLGIGPMHSGERSYAKPMREARLWRSPPILSCGRRGRPKIAQPGGKQRRLVFVLGGGGSRGACSVGVLKALLEAGIKPDGLVGCSSGAFNAVALAAKPDLETIEQLAQVWRSIRNRDLFNRNPLRMAHRYVRSRNSFFDSRYLRTLAAMNLPATFEQLVLPCAVIATNLTRARKEIFTTGSVPAAVAAAAAIPGLFNPYRIGDEEFVDGAVAENVGLPEAIQLGATHIVAIDNSTSNPRRPPNHTLTGIL